MDDLRLGPVGRADWYAGRAKDQSKKRSRPEHVESPDEPVDQVVLSSDLDSEEASPEEEPG